jgi:hypothetical protein
VVACKDAKQSRWSGRTARRARADYAAVLRGGMPAGQRPMWRTKGAYSASRRATLHGLPELAVLRIRIVVVVVHEVEHGLLAIELVRDLVALVAPYA